MSRMAMGSSQEGGNPAETARTPRVLYLPNETDCRDGFGQVGGRAAFEEMARSGVIAELRTYSFLAEFHARQKNREAAHRALLEEVQSFRPDILFWQHPIGYPLSHEFLREVRAGAGAPVIAYHEADPFDRSYKLIPKEVSVLYWHSDVFFTVGLGAARELFNRIRVHPRFHYSPSCVDRERFGAVPPRVESIGSQYDAVMIGTIGTRIRGLYRQPFSEHRIRLARGLARQFGDRFATFGAGWPAGTHNRGLIPYASQTSIIQTARMSVMWDLYPDYTFYFSDRLPIALLSGIPFVTNRRHGFDSVLAGAPGLYLADSIADAIDIAVYLRSLPIEEIASVGLSERAWALAHLEARVVFRRAFDICLGVWRGIA
jgi:hypothetical protein